MVQETTFHPTISDGMNGCQRFFKRLSDFILSLLCLIVLSPVFLFLIIVLMVTQRGAVFFSQERIGYHGKPFQIYKFRTMEKDSEDGVPMLAQKEDERQTPMGKMLREYHLDELPQLWNILIGNMSFVGPRPERRYFIEQIMQQNSDYELIYKMRPGATSLATIYNGYTDTMEKMLIRLQMDLNYYQKRSLSYDCKIIYTTFKYFIAGKKF